MNLKPPTSGGIANAFATGPGSYVSKSVSMTTFIAAKGLRMRTGDRQLALLG